MTKCGVKMDAVGSRVLVDLKNITFKNITAHYINYKIINFTLIIKDCKKVKKILKYN